MLYLYDDFLYTYHIRNNVNLLVSGCVRSKDFHMCIYMTEMSILHLKNLIYFAYYTPINVLPNIPMVCIKLIKIMNETIFLLLTTILYHHKFVLFHSMQSLFRYLCSVHLHYDFIQSVFCVANLISSVPTGANRRP